MKIGPCLATLLIASQKAACECLHVPPASNLPRTTSSLWAWVLELSPLQSTFQRCRIRPRWRDSTPPYRWAEWLSRKRSAAWLRCWPMAEPAMSLQQRFSPTAASCRAVQDCNGSTSMATNYDVIIIGSGAGGGTLARSLAATGKRILILERGDWLKREALNWDPKAVFVDNRYISPDTWYDCDGKPFQPQTHYFVGAPPKCTARPYTVCDGRTSANCTTTTDSRRPGLSATMTWSPFTHRPSRCIRCTASAVWTRPNPRRVHHIPIHPYPMSRACRSSSTTCMSQVFTLFPPPAESCSTKRIWPIAHAFAARLAMGFPAWFMPNPTPKCLACVPPCSIPTSRSCGIPRSSSSTPVPTGDQ